MTTEEIKRQLFEGINNIDEPDFLLTLKELIERKYSETRTPLLSEKQVAYIRKSEKEIEKGEYYTDDQVNQIIDQWLRE